MPDAGDRFDAREARAADRARAADARFAAARPACTRPVHVDQLSMATLGPLQVCFATRHVYGPGDRVVRLTGAQASTLQLLMNYHIATRDAIAALGLRSGKHQPGQRTVDQLASSLRRLLAEVSQGEVCVLSERGIGYRIGITGTGHEGPIRVKLRSMVQRLDHDGSPEVVLQVWLINLADMDRLDLPGKTYQLVAD